MLTVVYLTLRGRIVAVCRWCLMSIVGLFYLFSAQLDVLSSLSWLLGTQGEKLIARINGQTILRCVCASPCSLTSAILECVVCN